LFLTLPVKEVVVVDKPKKKIRLGTERKGITQRFRIGNLKGYMTVNEAVIDGRPMPAEIFMYVAKEGGTLSGFVNATALLISMCLQYGVPLEELCTKFIGWRFEPEGYVENADDIKYAESMLDYIFRWMALRYLGKDWLKKLDLTEGRRQPVGTPVAWEEVE
jgi:ribonucleoside-diphosphate reductase alpha chain